MNKILRRLNRILGSLDPDFYENDEEEEEEDSEGEENSLVNTISTISINVAGRISSLFSQAWPILRMISTGGESSDERNEEWEASQNLKNSKRTRGEILPPKLLQICMTYLPLNGLYKCRLVCLHWREVSAPLLNQKACTVINGEDEGCVEKFSKFLKSSYSKEFTWPTTTTTLRLIKMKESQIKILLNSTDFQLAVKNIFELELLFCEMSWTSLLKILKFFINLQRFLDNQTFYSSPSSFSSHDQPQGIIDTDDGGDQKREVLMDPNFMKKKEICLEDLKCLKIHKPNCSWRTTELLKILTMTTVDVEEFHFRADPRHRSVSVEEAFDFEQSLNVLFILNSDTLKCLYIDMMDTESMDYFNEFLKCLQDWASPHEASRLVLKEITLKFKYIWLSKAFESIFISLIKKTHPSLEQLGLGTIVLKPDSAHLLDKLKAVLSPHCKFEFGLYVTDHEKKPEQVKNDEEASGSSNFVNSVKSILETHLLYRQNMTELLVGIFYDRVTRLGDLIPCKGAVSFGKVNDVGIFTNGSSRPNFQTFDIQLITHNFRNATKLEIVDGPWENYFQNSFNFISRAVIGDQDLQLIMKCLDKLQTLMIFANMENLSDMGVTGLTSTAVSRMRERHEYRLLDSSEVEGYSFSNLKHLQYLSLRGIGSNLTDVCVYWGFNDMKSLKTLILAHFPKLTPEGRDNIHFMFPAKNECFVGIIN